VVEIDRKECWLGVVPHDNPCPAINPVQVSLKGGNITMMTYLKMLLHDDEAASAVEYGLLVALIAAVIILAVQGLGKTLNTTFTNVNSVIGAAAGS
jgi:pilus assembly protein Flp/PilA